MNLSISSQTNKFLINKEEPQVNFFNDFLLAYMLTMIQMSKMVVLDKCWFWSKYFYDECTDFR